MIISPDNSLFWREFIVNEKERKAYAETHKGVMPRALDEPALRYVVPLQFIEDVRYDLATLEREFGAREAVRNPWIKLVVSSAVGVLGVGASLACGAPEAAIALVLAAGGYGVHGFPDSDQRARVSPRAHAARERLDQLLREGHLFLLPENVQVTKTTDKRSMLAVSKLREYITARESIADGAMDPMSASLGDAEQVKANLKALRAEIDDLLNGEERDILNRKNTAPTNGGKRRSFASRIFAKLK